MCNWTLALSLPLGGGREGVRNGSEYFAGLSLRQGQAHNSLPPIAQPQRPEHRGGRRQLPRPLPKGDPPPQDLPPPDQPLPFLTVHEDSHPLPGSRALGHLRRRAQTPSLLARTSRAPHARLLGEPVMSPRSGIPPSAVRLCVVVTVGPAAQSAQGYSPQAASELAREPIEKRRPIGTRSLSQNDRRDSHLNCAPRQPHAQQAGTVGVVTREPRSPPRASADWGTPRRGPKTAGQEHCPAPRVLHRPTEPQHSEGEGSGPPHGQPSDDDIPFAERWPQATAAPAQGRRSAGQTPPLTSNDAPARLAIQRRRAKPAADTLAGD